MARRLVAALALVAGSSTASIAQRTTVDTTRWVYDVTPYLWASGIRGDVGVRDRSAHVSISFGKVIDHLDGAFMLPFEARRNRFGVGAEAIYTSISDDRARPGVVFTGASATAKQFIGSLGPRFRVARSKKLDVDVLFEARLWSLRNEVMLNLANGADLSSTLTKTWVDVVGGARGYYYLNDRWLVQLRGDFGGFGARRTWQAIGGVGYEASSRIVVRAGYRHLDVDFHDGDDAFLYDVGIGGPILGVTIRF